MSPVSLKLIKVSLVSFPPSDECVSSILSCKLKVLLTYKQNKMKRTNLQLPHKGEKLVSSHRYGSSPRQGQAERIS